MKAKIKYFLRTIVHTVCFLLVFTVLLQIGSMIFMPKFEKPEDGMIDYISSGFKGEPDNSLDVFLVGNSDLYRGIIPMDFWSEYGFSSFVCGLPAQKGGAALKKLDLALKKQNPKLVVVETDMFFGVENERTKGKYFKNTLKKVKEIFWEFDDSNFNDGLGTAISYKFPLIRYHSRWDELTHDDIKQPKKSYYYSGKGYVLSDTVKPYMGGFDYMKPTEKRAKLSKHQFRMLNSIVKLCEKNQIKLVFLELPSASSWSYEKHNAMSDYAKQKGIPFIDYNTDIVKETGFSWETDTKDGGDHLNLFGAQKITKHFGKYLQENYDIKNNKDNPDYFHWNDDFKRFNEDKSNILNDAQ